MAVFKDERKKTFLNPEGADKPLESRAAVTASEADTPRSLEAKAFAGLRGRGGLVTQRLDDGADPADLPWPLLGRGQ